MKLTASPRKGNPQSHIAALSRGSPVSETVREQIKEYIIAHGLKEGDPLPPETQWAQELGVNRSSVREAVKALESLGLLEIRHGQGLFVRSRNMDHLVETLRFDLELDNSVINELAEIRSALEMAMLPQALERIGPKEIESLEGILREWHDGFQPRENESILAPGPNIDVLWGMYDEMALGGLAAIKSYGLTGKITVMGYDNTPDAYAAIKRGEMHVTVDTAPKEMGYNLIHAIKNYVIDGKMIPKVIRSEIAVWDQSNINEFDTDNYYYAPMKARRPFEISARQIPGLAPAWFTTEGQLMSRGKEGSVERTGREPLPSKKAGPIRVGLIPTARNTHYDIVIAGARTAIDELGGPQAIDLVVHFPSHQSAVTEQIEVVKRWIEIGFDALAVCTANDTALTPLYKRAAERGIPVFLFNTPLALGRNPYYVCNVGYDQREAGRLIGLWLTQHVGDRPVNVAILEGLPGVHNDERLGGFKEGISGRENIKIVASKPADWLREKGQVIIDQVFQHEQDRQFHRTLYAALGNRTLLRLLDVYWQTLGDFLVDVPADPQTDLSEHVAILNAIKAHDPEAAQQALSKNLKGMQARVRSAVKALEKIVPE